MHFDAEFCEAGIEAIGWYHEKIDEERGVGLGPNHDWASHGADAFGLVAVARPIILDGSNLVKGRVLGRDQDGSKRERADRIGQHMTWQLLYRMIDWEEDTDKLLLMLPIAGCAFRKTYFDPIAGTNQSDMIPADDFVIDYWAKSLDRAPRYTHILHFYPYEVRAKFAADLWRKVQFSQEPENSDDVEGLVDFYEQHCMIDLDDDGIPEPYVVTTTTEGQVARIVPCFSASDMFVKDEAGKIVKATELSHEQLAALDIEIVRFERQQYFTKYGFIPAPDESFYDIGFGALLEDLSDATDGIINRLLDAGTLQNTQGGFLGAGINIKSGNMRFAPGEWKRVDTGGAAIKDSVVPLQLPGPSPVLFQLLGMLIEAAKEITSVQDVLTGASQGPNTPATTILAQIEQGQKVMTAIFKRIHRAFGKELRILRRLNRDHLDEEEYFQLNDENEPEAPIGHNGGPPLGEEQPEQQEMKVLRSDYEDDDLDVVPVSDPTMATDAQRMARSQVLMQFAGNPLVNQVEILQRVFEATGQTDIKKLLTVPPPPPDPKVLVDGLKTHVAKQQADNATLTAKSNAAKVLTDAAATALELGAIEDAAALLTMATALGSETDAKPADGPGSVPGVEGQSADAGLPPNPQPAPPLSDGGMGAGPNDDAGTAGPGGPPDPTGGPVA
jgi:chaperonin GroES